MFRTVFVPNMFETIQKIVPSAARALDGQICSNILPEPGNDLIVSLEFSRYVCSYSICKLMTISVCVLPRNREGDNTYNQHTPCHTGYI